MNKLHHLGLLDNILKGIFYGQKRIFRNIYLNKPLQIRFQEISYSLSPIFLTEFEKEFIELVVKKLELKLFRGNKSLCLNGLHFFLIYNTQRVLMAFFETQFLVIFHHYFK